jgi:hypothetical protein
VKNQISATTRNNEVIHCFGWFRFQEIKSSTSGLNPVGVDFLFGDDVAWKPGVMERKGAK